MFAVAMIALAALATAMVGCAWLKDELPTNDDITYRLFSR